MVNVGITVSHTVASIVTNLGLEAGATDMEPARAKKTFELTTLLCSEAVIHTNTNGYKHVHHNDVITY